MKNKLNLLWLIAVIGLVVMACDNGNQTTAHVHTAGAAATCVTPQTCTTCGEVMQGATGHDFEHDDWDEDEINASCEHPSYDTIACKNAPCTIKDRRTGSHPALGHNITGAYAATCTAEGYTGTGHCNRCDEDKTGVPLGVDPENHDFGEWTPKTAATCVAPERLIRVCSHNAAHYEEENHGEINTTAHNWNWTLNAIAATCVSISKDTATCKNTPCTVTNVRDGSNPALGHDHGTSGTGSLICKRENCDHQYAIGNTGPAGGIIFYVAASGFTIEGYTGSFSAYTAYYLEAAPANASESTMRWSNTNILIPNLSQDISDLTDRAIGRGRLNTAIIIAAHPDDTVANNAAKATAAYSQGGNDDWFLPNYEELNQMYIQRSHVGITTGLFWSSSQTNNINARAQDLVNGSRFNIDKNNGLSVRAIRAF